MKTVSARKLKREQPEDDLSPGQSLRITKHGGRVFELHRVDSPQRSHLAGLDEARREVPNKGGKPTDVAKWCAEDDL